MAVPQVRPGRSSQTPRAFNLPPIIILLTAVCVLIEIIRTYLLSDEANIWVLYMFAFIPARYGDPQLAASWQAFATPFSYSFLHGGFTHLINNCLWLLVFGSPLAATIRNGRFLLFWFVCAAIGAWFHYLAQPQDMTPMIGASGAISGMMGAAARFGFRMIRLPEGGSRFSVPAPPCGKLVRMPGVVVFLGIYLLMNLGIGATGVSVSGASIAWQAHLGGIVAGFIAAPFLARASR